MKAKVLLLACTAAMLASCVNREEAEFVPLCPSDKVFYASIEGADNSTKLYSDQSLKIFWDYGDQVSIFDHSNYNNQYAITPTGVGNAGYFTPVDEANLGTGTLELPYVLSIFPYSEETSVNDYGELSIVLPSVQEFGWNTFGPKDNTMIAVSEDNTLLFKNICGYLAIPLYGDGIGLSSVNLTTNGGEPIAGSAKVVMPIGGRPTVTMADTDVSSSIDIQYPSPLNLYAGEDSAIEVWFTIPPCVMSGGFTLTVKDQYGGVFTASTTGEVTINRNSITRMAAIEVVPEYEDMSGALEVLYTQIGQPCKLFNNPDDWQFLMMLYCNDLEGADAVLPDTGYNWFSTCGTYQSRNNAYRNPRIRYDTPMNMIASANKFIKGIDEATANPGMLHSLAELRALRAWSYMWMAQMYQFNYQVAADQPCVPIITENTPDGAEVARATVSEVYNFIFEDLDFAVSTLENTERANKSVIDGHVAHGLRARANMLVGNWDAAYNDALAAADGFTPASIAEVSRPSFYDISEHNWIWGYDMPDGYPASIGGNACFATTSSWLRSFSAQSYASMQTYTSINNLLWNMIPASDVRKGWWVDENLQSPLLEGLAWPGFEDVATADDGGNKRAYLPYTNVKFGCKTVGTTANDEDMPLMRVEEMILIQAEAKARYGDYDTAVGILEDFVRTYRDPDYYVPSEVRPLLDEIWFQRRVELWGEGFGVFDNLRLQKPIVRFHDDNGNVPEAFRFNIAAGDPWLLMRFPQTALNNNPALVDNTGGAQPQSGQNADLLDGVTD